MEEKKQCPFCGEEVNTEVLKCKHCAEWLNQPTTNLNAAKAVLPEFKIMNTGTFIFLSIITLGLYPTIWITLNRTKFNNLSPQKNKHIGIIYISIMWVLSIGLLIATFMEKNVSPYIMWVVYFDLTVKGLKLMEAYAKETYNKDIKHNLLGILFFTIFYLNFAINTFNERISKVQ